MKKYFIKEFININNKNGFAIYSFIIDVTTKCYLFTINVNIWEIKRIHLFIHYMYIFFKKY